MKPPTSAARALDIALRDRRRRGGPEWDAMEWDAMTLDERALYHNIRDAINAAVRAARRKWRAK